VLKHKITPTKLRSTATFPFPVRRPDPRRQATAAESGSRVAIDAEQAAAAIAGVRAGIVTAAGSGAKLAGARPS